jgi:hypothetical protein
LLLLHSERRSIFQEIKMQTLQKERSVDETLLEMRSSA